MTPSANNGSKKSRAIFFLTEIIFNVKLASLMQLD